MFDTRCIFVHECILNSQFTREQERQKYGKSHKLDHITITARYPSIKYYVTELVKWGPKMFKTNDKNEFQSSLNYQEVFFAKGVRLPAELGGQVVHQSDLLGINVGFDIDAIRAVGMAGATKMCLHCNACLPTASKSCPACDNILVKTPSTSKEDDDESVVFIEDSSSGVSGGACGEASGGQGGRSRENNSTWRYTPLNFNDEKEVV